MPNFDSLKVQAAPNTFPSGYPGNMVAFYFEAAIGTSTLNLANLDTVTFGKVPKGFRLLHAILGATDLDTGSATLAWNVGDTTTVGAQTFDADRIFAACTVGQAAAITPLGGNGTTFTAACVMAATGFGYRYLEDTTIVATAATGPATGTTGTLKLVLIGVVEGTAS
jgi:hypothetical protein